MECVLPSTVRVCVCAGYIQVYSIWAYVCTSMYTCVYNSLYILYVPHAIKHVCACVSVNPYHISSFIFMTEIK